MLKKNVIPAGVFLLLSSSALACSGREGSWFEYWKSGKGTAYVTVGYDRQLEKTVIDRYVTRLPDVSWHQLRRIPDMASWKWKKPQQLVFLPKLWCVNKDRHQALRNLRALFECQ